MTTRIGINGFGRIGRQVTKAITEEYTADLEVVAVNDLADNETLAHLLKYDSTYGIFDADIGTTEDSISIAGREIAVFAERDPLNIPWGAHGVDIVIEATGVFRDADLAKAHLNAGAKKVIITAPGKNEDLTIVLGVNDELYNPEKHHIVSNASCTTNCVAPVAKVLHENFGIKQALMTTIHAYTNDQNILDGPHKDLRRARSAGLSIIPTTTGAARAVAQVIPELQGKIDGFALRVPIPTVSLVDLTVDFESDVTTEAINSAFKMAADGALEGILGYTEEPLVSVDYQQNSNSSIVDGLLTLTSGSRMGKVISWYDNEWGYSVRTVDLCVLMATAGL